MTIGASYDQLFDPAPIEPSTSDGRDEAAVIGDMLRHAFGLSAWKQFHRSRWCLRVNPSSGNLHPTEVYVVCGPLPGLSAAPGVYHYAPDRHALELRCAFDRDAWRARVTEPHLVLVALASIHWRESWKYGERAFRYCQHDLGHAIAALGLAARLVGRRASVFCEWSHSDIAALIGADRDADFVEAEREEPGCVIGLTARGAADGFVRGRRGLVEAVRQGNWTGRANRLSDDRVSWPVIDEVALATRDSGRDAVEPAQGAAWSESRESRPLDARRIILQRRSAVSFDGRSTIGRDRFHAMLSRAMPGLHAPWDALWWTPRVHLLLFVHRVHDVDPGLYLLVRDRREVDAAGRSQPLVEQSLQRLRASFGRDFLWERADDRLPLMLLARGDSTRLAKRLSCDQDIASHGYFSFAMVAAFDASLEEYGPSFYRNLFWETGVIGQVMYLEAEAAGARATGIGCFYDDPVHEVLGLQGHAFQSLYHFTVGTPVEDTRLTTEPGYSWEREQS
jgi:SagB-type dehydrogenase family enzyme